MSSSIIKTPNPRCKHCPWCRNTYTSAGAYANHVQKDHPINLCEIHTTVTDAPNTLFDDNCDSNHKELQEEDNKPTTDDNPRHADKHYPEAGAIILHSSQNPSRLYQTDNPLHPFETVSEYKLARFFYCAKVPKGIITEFFINGLAPTDIMGYKSGEAMRNTVDSIVDTPS